MLGQLVPCGGGPPIPLLLRRLVVGRDYGCDIPLPYTTVSARHCQLDYRDGFWFVCDLQSSNGTRVNGVTCTEKCLLPGDELALSRYRFTLLYTVPPGKKPPSGPTAPSSQRRLGAPAGATAPAPSGRSLGKLLPCGGGQPIALPRPRLVVGRRDDCDVVIRHGTISGRHCQLDYDKATWHVRDLGSRNGIRVGGVRCVEQDLPPGAILSLAALRYEIVYGSTGPGSAPPPGPSFGQGLLEKAGLDHWPDAPADDDLHDDLHRRLRLDESPE